MVKKTSFSIEKIKELDVDKLAHIVYDEAIKNSAFKRSVKAALAGLKGVEGVAKIVDLRLNSLKRSKGFIDREKSVSLKDDLSSLVDIICRELATFSPAIAIDRLLVFIKMCEQVCDRVDDYNGNIQDIFQKSLNQLPILVKGLKSEELDFLPEKITKQLLGGYLGFFTTAMRAVCPLLSQEQIQQWDDLLQSLYVSDKECIEGNKYLLLCIDEGRQIIAFHLNNVDEVVALEANKHPNRQNILGIANYLFKQNQLKKALVWVRKQTEKPIGNDEVDYIGFVAISGHVIEDEYLHIPANLRAAHLEAKILTALGDRAAAQKRRWLCFEKLLSSVMLREYIANLDDFEEFDETDRAISFVVDSPYIYNALNFFIEWPKLDYVSQLVIKHYNKWDGRNFDILPKAAKALEHKYAFAATVLYRVLIDNILNNQKTKAYHHAVNYYKILGNLSKVADAEGSQYDFYIKHDDYIKSIQSIHGRKTSFGNLYKN